MATDDSNIDRSVAPPVVAVVVVHDPGEWFDDTLESLVRQDYPNLNTLFLLTGAAGDDDTGTGPVTARIRSRLPDAFVRIVDDGSGVGPGFGPTANAVLDVVEGDSGFFCICHDDIALAPDAIRVMVEELYRANAGVVGPKLVNWDNANVLQDVGLDVDRFAAAAARVELGEYDQQQRDADVDVFAVPSACLLVRADLLRMLGGFDAAMRYHGEDVDLCWRARLTGARVIVAPRARVRHRGELDLRRPDLNHPAMRARHRMRTTLTLTAGARLPLRIVELLGLTLAEIVVGVFTGHPAESWASVRALVGAVPRVPTTLARRGSIAKMRRDVGGPAGRAAGVDANVTDHLSGGSNHLRSFGRMRDMRTLIGVEENIRRWRERSLAPLITWGLVLLAVLAASRTFINQSVPVLGEFLPFPSSVGDLWSVFRSGWNPSGLGATSANPSGLAGLAVGSVLWLFNMSAGLTVLIVGLIMVGCLGVWRLADLFPSNRERIVALVAYAAMPLIPGVVSTGRLGPLTAYAAVPWFVHLVRQAIGIGTADPASVSADLVDGIIGLTPRERVRRAAVLAIVAALAIALAPPLLLVLGGVAVVLGLATLLIGAGWRTAAWMSGTGIAALGAAWCLNLPSSATWSWNDLTAVPLAGPPGRGLVAVAAMDIGAAPLGSLALALYIPVLVGLLLSRAWRLTWAARAAGLVIAFGTLAVLQDRDVLPVRLPEVGFLLAPVALGLAVAAASAVASFASDVAGGSFGWRQPVGLVSVAAVGLGMFPSLLTITDGSWYAPSTTMFDLVAPQIQADPAFGDFRVLYLGDPRVLPGAVTDLGDTDEFETGCTDEQCAGQGIAMTLTGPDIPGIESIWAAPDTSADAGLRAALGDIAGNLTQRGGRLLAPFAIRYVVVPVYDGAASTPDHPIEVPAGLLGALGSQLDLELRYSAPNFVLFENRSAVPGAALLTGAAAGNAAAATPAELAQADLSSGQAALGTVLDDQSGSGPVEPGVLQLAVSYDQHWALAVDGQDVVAREGVSSTTAFDITAAGAATIGYAEPGSRQLQLVGQAALWLLTLVLASRLRLPGVLRRLHRSRPADAQDVAIDLDTLERPDGPQGVDVVTELPNVTRSLPDDGVSIAALAARAVAADREHDTPTRPAVSAEPRSASAADPTGDATADDASWFDEMFGADDEEPGGGSQGRS